MNRFSRGARRHEIEAPKRTRTQTGPEKTAEPHVLLNVGALPAGAGPSQGDHACDNQRTVALKIYTRRSGYVKHVDIRIMLGGA